jgi:hypothetical protein
MSLYCPISVKFCTRDLHVLLLTDCDIVKTAAGKAVLLLWTYIQLEVHVCRSESKEHRVEVSSLRHGVRHLTYSHNSS